MQLFQRLWILEISRKAFPISLSVFSSRLKKALDIRVRLQNHYPAGYPTGKPDSDHLWLVSSRHEHVSGLDRTAIFLKFGGSGLDRTEKFFIVLIWLFWTYQKFQFSLDFTDLLNGSVYLAIKGKNSAENILKFELYSPLSRMSTYNAEFL